MLDLCMVREIIQFSPNSVFEFGCGSGKNLATIKTFTMPENRPETWGLDISIVNVMQAHCAGVDCCIRGDERHIPARQFDVVFTVSVLDHIEDIHNIIGAFQSIATKAILLGETYCHLNLFFGSRAALQPPGIGK